eukprot:CAMPEP_0172598328 /NCGR_PEP_ID=MMETSP1068-20121228/18359_1 /TAXON_ID=35684 /ORGANISM="Pseudopedinella elastica, Strain CCMP716" /LENGTH=53 /DNA_ID=CAMNT_0013398167 /DNA_START=561 /DNA_END=718 /DNA_ORIENTATION=+
MTMASCEIKCMKEAGMNFRAWAVYTVEVALKRAHAIPATVMAELLAELWFRAA